MRSCSGNCYSKKPTKAGQSEHPLPWVYTVLGLEKIKAKPIGWVDAYPSGASKGSTWRFICSGVKGLRMYPRAPQATASATRDSLASEVIIRTGTPRAFSTVCKWRINSRRSEEHTSELQ